MVSLPRILKVVDSNRAKGSVICLNPNELYIRDPDFFKGFNVTKRGVQKPYRMSDACGPYLLVSVP